MTTRLLPDPAATGGVTLASADTDLTLTGAAVAVSGATVFAGAGFAGAAATGASGGLAAAANFTWAGRRAGGPAGPEMAGTNLPRVRMAGLYPSWAARYSQPAALASFRSTPSPRR